jgi:hypothetical protein
MVHNRYRQQLSRSVHSGNLGLFSVTPPAFVFGKQKRMSGEIPAIGHRSQL